MHSIFVCGTDTGVGKTYFCGRLLKYLLDRKQSAGYQKWVSTGHRDLPADLVAVMNAAAVSLEPEILDLQVPFRFSMPASPHLAGETEGRSVVPEKVRACFRELRERYELLVVEGVGGLLVPLTRDLLLADLLAELQLPTLVVARSGLGTLNHTLLTLEALRNREVPILGVVFSDSSEQEDDTIVADNLKTVAEMGRVTVFGRMARIPGDDSLAGRAFSPIGGAILRAINFSLA